MDVPSESPERLPQGYLEMEKCAIIPFTIIATGAVGFDVLHVYWRFLRDALASVVVLICVLL